MNSSAEFAKLLEPGQIGKLEVKNRMVMLPMLVRYEMGGKVTDRMVTYYLERARGGVGLVVIEGAYSCSGGHPERLGIYDDKFIPGLKRLAEAIHEADCRVAIEINVHRGRLDNIKPVCSSDAPIFISLAQEKKHPKVLTIKEIESLVKQFGEGVGRGKEAGFDAMMVHGGSSYLVYDFLSPLSNARTDEYGGDIKGRAKFALDLVESARKNAGEDYPIIFRLPADQRTEGGFSLSDALQVCRMLEEAGTDAIDVTSGGFGRREWGVAPMVIPRGFNRGLSSAIKGALNIPVIVSGRINDAHLAEELLERSEADFIGLGRALIADPNFPKKIIEGRVGDIRKCIACLNCQNDILFKHIPLRCTVNARVGKEKELEVKRPERTKRVLVVGGGPGGMETARIAALRGHKVTLWEKTDKLGGLLNLACLPPHKEEIRGFLQYLTNQIEKLPIAVRLKKEATVTSVLQFGPEVVVIATGSRPYFPKIAGLGENKEDGRIVTARDVLEGTKEVGERIIVLGGNLVGCETAEFLADKGKKVIMTTLEERFALDSPATPRLVLLRRLEEKGVTQMPRVRYEAITDEGGVITTDGSNKILLRADNIVLAAGATPNREIYLELQGKVPECYTVGDCVEARNILKAIHEAVSVACRI